jgi:hypothetical protein
LNLRGANYIEYVYPLIPGHSYVLGDGLTLSALTAYHDEIVTKDYAVGALLEFAGENDRRKIIITSDTSLLPRDPSGEGVDGSGKEVWDTYAVKAPIDLLVAHIGSMKEKEFTRLDEEEKRGDMGLSKLIYENHLGILGTVRVISSLSPSLAVVSEFGEELASVQEELIKMIVGIVGEFCINTGKTEIPVVPGDLPFIYRVWDRTAYCIFGKQFVPATDLAYGVPDPQSRRFYYYHQKWKNELDFQFKAAQCATDFEKARRARTLGALYFRKTPPPP